MNFKYIAFFCLILSGHRSAATEPHIDGYLYSANNPPPEFAHNNNNLSRSSSSGQAQEASIFMTIIAAGFFIKELFVGESKEKQQRRAEQDRKNRIEREGRKERQKTIDSWEYSEFLEHFRLSDPLLRENPKKDFFNDQAFCQVHLYKYPGFQDVLMRHPSYYEYVAQLQQKVKYDKKFAAQYLYKPGELETIVEEMVWTAEFLINYRKEKAEKCAAAEQKQAEDALKHQAEDQRKAQEKAILKELKQNKYKELITSVMQDPNSELIGYYEQYQVLEIEKLQASQAQYVIKRFKALDEHVKGNDIWEQQEYLVSYNAKNLLRENSIDPMAYSSLFGNQIQHVLHNEFVLIMDDTAQIRYHLDTTPQDIINITNTLTRFADAGRLHNHAGYAKKAVSFADFCWGMIDCAQRAYAFECKLENAIGRGFLQGGRNYAVKVLDPIKTLRDMQSGIQGLAKIAVELNEDLKLKAYLLVKNAILQNAYDIRDLVTGDKTVHDLLQRDVKQFCYSFGQSVTQVHGVLNSAWNKVTPENMLYAAEHGIAITTEMALSHATFTALGSLGANGSTALSEIISAGDGTMDFLDLPFTSGAFEASIAYESIFAQAAEHAAELVQVAGVQVAQALDKASVIAPPLLLAADGGPEGNGLSSPASGFNYPEKLPIRTSMKDDLSEIKQLFDQTRKGFESIESIFIKMDIEHILEGEVITKIKGARVVKKLHGCHHDLLGYLEENNIIDLQDKILGKFGTYKARPFGHKIDKCFFPQHWLRREVIANIYEAYDDFKLSRAIPTLGLDGKWIIRGFSKIGLEIEMYIDQGGVIRTAFPVL